LQAQSHPLQDPEQRKRHPHCFERQWPIKRPRSKEPIALQREVMAKLPIKRPQSKEPMALQAKEIGKLPVTKPKPK